MLSQWSDCGECSSKTYEGLLLGRTLPSATYSSSWPCWVHSLSLCPWIVPSSHLSASLPRDVTWDASPASSPFTSSYNRFAHGEVSLLRVIEWHLDVLSLWARRLLEEARYQVIMYALTLWIGQEEDFISVTFCHLFVLIATECGQQIR